MRKVNRYEFEGEVIEVPVYWDEHLQRETENYECKDTMCDRRGKGGMRMKKRLMPLLLCLCLVFAMLPATAFAGEETEAEAVCTCTALCSKDSINADCPVCGAEEADLAACQGAETETQIKKTETSLPATENSLETMKTGSTLVTDGSEAKEAEPDTQAIMLAAPAPLAVTAYDTLRIGNTHITDSGYWTTDANGNLTVSDADNYNIAFDADSNTLTLNNATIVGSYDANNNPNGTGIYAYSSSGDVSLTIQVTGNNVVSSDTGIYALSNGGRGIRGDQRRRHSDCQ